MSRPLSDLLEKINYESLSGEVEMEITGISHDSRSVEPGNVFAAIPGNNVDGHDFVGEAVDAGADVVIGKRSPEGLEIGSATYVRVEDPRRSLARASSAFYGEPTESLFTVGVTGTNGKSTTVHLTEKVLGEDETGVVSTINNEETPGREGPVTTPEAPGIHKVARDARRAGKDSLILEVSSHGLALDRVEAVDFDSAVFTNLTRDHLDYHESLQEYKNAKLKLFRYLKEGDTAVLNDDEPFSDRIAKRTKAETISYGFSPSADVMATDRERSRSGISFVVRSPWGSTGIELGLVGEYNVHNGLAAVAVGLRRGIELSKLAERLEGYHPLPGRMEKLELDSGADVYVDFAHNPGALERSLRELNRLYGSVSVVFGCGGESDRGKRPEMGKVAGKYGDRIYLTDDNPKKEDRMEILREIEEGLREGSNYSVVPDRKEAIARAVEELTPESALLIAGKGHERFQIVDDEWISYNDRNYVERICREKSLI